LCTVRFEPKRQIIVADFERLVATIGRLEAMTQGNQEKVEPTEKKCWLK
jgi:hypothetical protein